MLHIEDNKDLSPLTTFGVPARSRWYASYSSYEELLSLSRTPQYLAGEVLHIGGGSNLLFVHDYDGLVIRSEIKGIEFYRKNADTVYAIVGAGETFDDLVARCVEEGYAGLENLSGIPGQVGASAVQNIGAYGMEAADSIFAVECFDTLTRETVRLSNEQCRFGYRDSIFKGDERGRYYVLRVSYRLKPTREASNLIYGPLKALSERLGHAPDIAEVRKEVLAIRDSKLPDPKVIGNAGSFFKNPVVRKAYYEAVVLKTRPDVPCYEVDETHVKIPAGWLIEQAGLKGHAVGGAQVYPKQCLVIANTGGATAADVVKLSDEVCRRVRKVFAVQLHPEVNFIDTQIEVTVLGSGTSKGVPEIGCECDVCKSTDPRDKRLRSSVLVRTRGMNILIDPSPDFRTQALAAGIDDLDAILITHIHYDHVGGIDDVRPITTFHGVPVYTTPDVAAALRTKLDYVFGDNRYPGVPALELREIGDEPFHINGLQVTPITVYHGKKPIVAYRIGDFAYVTDAVRIDEDEKEKLLNLDALIVNALRIEPHFAHFTLAQALELIGELRPRRAWLTHIAHEMGRHADVDAMLPEGVHPAYDGLRFTVS